MAFVITGDAATNRTNLGLGTAATLNVGTSANNIVQLDASGNLPAIDGSSLTGITAGGVLQVKTGTYDGNATIGGTFSGGQLTVSVTPKQADSSFLIIANCFFGYSNHDVAADIGFDVSGAAPGGTITPEGSPGNGDACFQTSGIGTTASDTAIDDWSISTTPAHYFWTPSSNLGTSTRTFQILARRRGSGGSIIWNSIWSAQSDARSFRTVSTLTVLEISSGVI